MTRLTIIVDTLCWTAPTTKHKHFPWFILNKQVIISRTMTKSTVYTELGNWPEPTREATPTMQVVRGYSEGLASNWLPHPVENFSCPIMDSFTKSLVLVGGWEPMLHWGNERQRWRRASAWYTKPGCWLLQLDAGQHVRNSDM